MIGSQQSQSKLILYLLILLGLAGGYLYVTSFSVPSADVPPLPQESRDDDWKPLKALNVDFKLLDTPEYKNLRIFGELPVNPGIHGKDDPFN